MNQRTHTQNMIWHSIWNAVNTGLILIDAKSVVLLWNDWVSEHSGIDEKHAVGQSLETLFAESLGASFKTAMQNALAYKLPVVLSSALHRSPLPLYPLPCTRQKQQARIHQSITLTPIITPDGAHQCLIQITDTSVSFAREHLLKLHSRQLSIDATTDSLTGAYNRRYFDERFKAEFGRVHRQGTPLSLLMLDIDYFKDYNDFYGHPAGDRVLIRIVELIKSQLNRTTDVVTRYGGEEFAILLPDCELEGAYAVAQKIQSAMLELNIPHAKSNVTDRVTLSIGIATHSISSNCDANFLLNTADTALYTAKHDGRNCIRHLFTQSEMCKNAAYLIDIGL
ncbi:MAG: diguanylate cyclase [Nitrosomonadales bacterium]|jgi:diguanylate cyclase (GGDEF)-like protein